MRVERAGAKSRDGPGCLLPFPTGSRTPKDAADPGQVPINGFVRLPQEDAQRVDAFFEGAFVEARKDRRDWQRNAS